MVLEIYMHKIMFSEDSVDIILDPVVGSWTPHTSVV